MTITNAKNILPIAATALLMSFFSGIYFFGHADPVNAQQQTTTSSDELQDELNLLGLQVEQLQAVLTLPASATEVSVTASAVFPRDLTLGDSGPDVKALQQFLNTEGGLAQVALAGHPGSPGNETDYYGLYTETAVARWQTIEGILPAEGYFGASTRALVVNLDQ